MTNMKLAYVAGKLSDDATMYIKHLHRMIRCADKIKKLGWAVYVPGIDFLMGLQIGDYDYKDYFENSQTILRRCDAVIVVPGWETSKGTQKEINLAHRLSIPVWYFNEEDGCLYDDPSFSGTEGGG